MGAHGNFSLAPQLVVPSTSPACRTVFSYQAVAHSHLAYSFPNCLEVVASVVTATLLERDLGLAPIVVSLGAETR